MLLTIPQQLFAFMRLQWAQWTRGALLVGRAASRSPRQGMRTGMIILFLWSGAISLWSRAAMVVEHENRVAMTHWVLIGAALLAASFSFSLEVPSPRNAFSLLHEPLMESLPIPTLSRLFLSMSQDVLTLVYVGACVLGACPELRTTALGWAEGFLILVSIHVTMLLFAVAVAAILRQFLAPHIMLRVSMAASMGNGLSTALIFLSGWMATHHPLTGVETPLLPLARALAGDRLSPMAMLPLALFAVSNYLIIKWADARGYDRGEGSPGGKRGRPAPPLATLGDVEKLINSRQFGGRAAPALTIFATGVVIWLGKATDLASRDTLMSVLLVQMCGVVALRRATLAVQRDVRVRPLLAPLPLEPNATLEGKARALRALVMPIALAYIPIMLSHDGIPTVLWHGITLAVGMWVFCDAAVCVAFMTGGLGLPGVSAVGPAINMTALLLFFPLLGAVLAPHPLGSVLCLVGLWAVGFEARRSAQRCVRWIDDTDDTIGRETSVWRALLAFAVFVAVQALSARLFRVGEGGSSTWAMLLSYGLAAVVLTVMTYTGREGLPPLRLWPSRAWTLGAGAIAGMITGTAGIGYLYLLRRSGYDGPLVPDLSARSAQIALTLTVVVAAPVAEEIFFRGWLQEAITDELPAHRKRLGFLLAAFAFAAAHSPVSFLPVLLLGLATGLLYAASGSVMPGIVAHAIHNFIALWLVKL